MVRLPMPAHLRQTAPSMLSHASAKLLRALPRQPHPRAHFSSASQLWSYQSLRAATPEESDPTPPTSSSPAAADTVKYPSPVTQPLHVRYREITDSISRTTKKALAAALENSSTKRSARYGDFLVHFGGGSQKPKMYLPDGTDRFHWPGEPWNRRVWAGGSITWGEKWADTFELPREVEAEIARDGQRNAESYLVTRMLKCVERIQSSEHKGVPGSGQEKVLVKTRRTYLPEQRHVQDPTSESFAVTERRDLVFMRSRTEEEANKALSLPDRIIKPTATPDSHISLTPRQPLLAEFSCLTHNAHRIHLDRGYAASEGFRNLVVHGPLSLYLMLTYLESLLPADAQIVQFDYRNLAPLFCDEKMKVCVRKTSDSKVNPANEAETAAKDTNAVAKDTETAAKDVGAEAQDASPQSASPATPSSSPTNPPPTTPTHQTYDVYILNSLGGYAVKGTATIHIPPPTPPLPSIQITKEAWPKPKVWPPPPPNFKIHQDIPVRIRRVGGGGVLKEGDYGIVKAVKGMVREGNGEERGAPRGGRVGRGS